MLNIILTISTMLILSGCDFAGALSDQLLPPEVNQVIKATETMQHLGIKIGGVELDLLKTDERANELITGFIGSLLEDQDLCMKNTAQYFHETMKNGECANATLAQSILPNYQKKIRATYKTADSYEIDSVYKANNNDIDEKGKFYNYYLINRMRRVQVFFPSSNKAPIITEIYFIK